MRIETSLNMHALCYLPCFSLSPLRTLSWAFEKVCAKAHFRSEENGRHFDGANSHECLPLFPSPHFSFPLGPCAIHLGAISRIGSPFALLALQSAVCEGGAHFQAMALNIRWKRTKSPILIVMALFCRCTTGLEKTCGERTHFWKT